MKMSEAVLMLKLTEWPCVKIIKNCDGSYSLCKNLTKMVNGPKNAVSMKGVMSGTPAFKSDRAGNWRGGRYRK